jgi:hypothetical protein
LLARKFQLARSRLVTISCGKGAARRARVALMRCALPARHVAGSFCRDNVAAKNA